MWTLRNTETGETVNNGDEVKTFRGEVCVLDSWSAPAHAGSTGRIYVKCGDRECTESYFPSVCGLEIIEVSGTPAITVGDVVKSYDFAGNREYYIIGQVMKIGPVEGLEANLDRYHIRMIAQVRKDECDLMPGDLCFPPVNGVPTLMGNTTRGVVPFWD